jgi:hypothetical protein
MSLRTEMRNRPVLEEDVCTAELVDTVDAMFANINGTGNGAEYIELIIRLQRAAAAEVERLLRDYIEVAPHFAPPSR